jgi:hypothetical protein
MALAFALVAAMLAWKARNEFTSSKPEPLPSVNLSEAEINHTQQQVRAFQLSVSRRQPTAPLQLTAGQINALIASEAPYQALRGKFYFTIDDDKLKAQVSLPAEEAGLKLPLFRGRYLNGVGTFSLAFDNGNLRIGLESLSIEGKPLPEAYSKRLRAQNLASWLLQNPRASMALERLQDVEVKGGRLIIMPKPD